MDACQRLAQLLQQAGATWGLAAAGTGGPGCEVLLGRMSLLYYDNSARLAGAPAKPCGSPGKPLPSAGGGSCALQQAAFSRMSEELAGWVVADTEGPSQLTPSPGQALLAASLPALRYANAAAGLQLAAVNLAAGVA